MTVLVKPIVAEPRRCYRTHHAQRPFDAPLLPPDPTIGATPRPRRAGPRRGPAGDDPSHCEPDSRPWQAASLALRARAARDASSVRGAVASRLSRRTSRSGPAGYRGDRKRVVAGKSGSVRDDIGGPRIIKKKNNIEK